MRKLLADATFVSGFVIGLLLVAGWSYAHTRFTLLGVNVQELESDASALGLTYVTYGLWALEFSKEKFIVYLGVFFFIQISCLSIIQNVKLHNRFQPSFILDFCRAFLKLAFAGILAWCVFSFAINAGERYAVEQVRSMVGSDAAEYSAAITIYPDEKENVLRSLSISDDEAKCLRRFFVDKKSIYFFVWRQSNFSALPRGVKATWPKIFIVSRDKIKGYAIESNAAVCP
jgi:hypothetical protein